MKRNLWVQESFINASKGCRIGDSEVYETCFDDRGKLFRFCQREYGRCTSKVYIDRPNGKARAIGWVFLKREQYTDTHEPYIQETWVTRHAGPPDVRTKYHYR